MTQEEQDLIKLTASDSIPRCLYSRVVFPKSIECKYRNYYHPALYQ